MTQTLSSILPFDFDQPAWLWLCLLIPLLVGTSWRHLSGLDSTRRVFAIAVRSLLIVLVAVCLARVKHVQRNNDLTVMFLMDRSHSVESLQEYQDKFIREASRDIPPDDRLGMIDFARNAFIEQPPQEGGYHMLPGRLPLMTHVDRTNIASALQLAMAIFPHDTAKRIVLMSDGNDNMGDVLTEARRARADHIPIDVVPLQYKRRNEVFFDKMIAPTHAEPGEQLPIRMVISTTLAVSGTITIFHNGRLVPLSPQQSHVDLEPGPNTLFIKLGVDGPGAHTFEATFRPDDPRLDATAANNTASAFSFVSGVGRVLLISSEARQDQPLLDALQSENVKVDMKTTDQLGTFDLLQMMTYSSIILANVPASVFTDEQHRDFVTYVRDMGSGLIMTGGDEGFGAGGWIGSPVEEIMPVTFEIKHKRVIPRGALVVIMHSCEIARGNYWGKEMAKKSVDTISSQDYIGVLCYQFSPPGVGWTVPLQLATNKNAVKTMIDRMQNGDMPDFDSAMRLAYKELSTGLGRDAAQKHVIILSDGDASPPTQSLLDQYKASGITVSTIALGWGGHVSAAPMMRVANATGGKYYQARNPRQLPQIFVKESKVVRRPLIIDEPFPPQLLYSNDELLGGVASFPPLGGLVLTSAKQSPNVIIPLIRATDDGDDPVLVHWQYELGKTVAFTSGYWATWGRQWTNWPKFAKLWAQIVRWTMRQEAPANFDVYTKVDGSRGRIMIDALDADASYLNALQLGSRGVGPDGKVKPIEFVQTGPGHYEAEIDIEQAGQYLANVQVTNAQGRSIGTIRTGFSVPFSPEYRDLRPNEALLRDVVEISGGRWLDMPARVADVFSHDLPATTSKRPAWEWVLAWLLLPAFLLDIAVRRLASWLAFSIAVELVILFVFLFGFDLRYGWGIFGAFLLAELVGWTIRFRYIAPLFDWLTHTVTALGHKGERSALALQQLRSTRDRVRQGLDAPSESSDLDESSASILAANAQRRYEADDSAGTDAIDLETALGEAAPTDRPERKPAGSNKPTDKESATERLLRAKRRSQRGRGGDDS